MTSLYIISDAPKYDIIWTENSDVIDSLISEIFKYKSWILASWRKRSWTVDSHRHAEYSPPRKPEVKMQSK